MAGGFKKEYRERIIQEYLNASGKNAFVPSEFLDWLKDRPDHECHKLFFGMSEADAAMAQRENLVRQWVSGLRIKVIADIPEHQQVNGIKVREIKLPMMISPTASRRDGGGYMHTDPTDEGHIIELVSQGARALSSWAERYEGAASILGVDLSKVKLTIAEMEMAVSEDEEKT